VDPLAETDIKVPRVRAPKAYRIDDALFLRPPSRGRAELAVVRGPSIGKVPVNAPLPDVLKGVVAIKVGDKVTTDHIMPAGQRLKHRSNVEAYARYVFEGVDAAFPERAAKHRDAGLHNIIVAGDSYGQGSSREHAALCPMFLGVKVVLARSIERIHLANLINFGIVPCVFAGARDYEGVAVGDALTLEGFRKVVEEQDGAVLRNETRGTTVRIKLDLTARQRKILLAGGLLNTVAKGARKA
jgi:aconitate hydratase